MAEETGSSNLRRDARIVSKMICPSSFPINLDGIEEEDLLHIVMVVAMQTDVTTKNLIMTWDHF